MSSMCDNVYDEDSDDEAVATAVRAILAACIRRSRAKKRRFHSSEIGTTTRKKRGGRVGRRWTQRNKGPIFPAMFAWWRLINAPDVDDSSSRNGKVRIQFSCPLPLQLHACALCISCLYVRLCLPLEVLDCR